MENKLLETGRVVKSTAGRDTGCLMAVLKQEYGYVLVCDGKERPLERPKKKNPKHIERTNLLLDKQEMESNRKLRKALCESTNKSLEEVK